MRYLSVADHQFAGHWNVVVHLESEYLLNSALYMCADLKWDVIKGPKTFQSCPALSSTQLSIIMLL